MSNFKIKDRLLLSSFSGGLAAIAANFFLYGVNLFLPGDTINMPELTADIFLNIDPKNITVITRILGFIWSMTIGGIYSLLYIITLDLTGWNNLTIKSVLVILAGWLLGAGSLIKLMSLVQYTRNEPLSIAAFFIAHIFFAIILSLIVKYVGAKNSK